MYEHQVLVADLGGAIVKTDLVYESFWLALSQNAPKAIFGMKSIIHSRAHLKFHLAEGVSLDPSLIPYNRCVLEFIRNWRAGGGRTALVAEFDQTLADDIADHLGLFDEVHASNGARHLDGRKKAEFLIQQFGVGRYDYIGDSLADLPTWENARRAITVGATATLRRAVEACSSKVQHLDTEPRNSIAYLRALRPHQWLKNVLIFLPAVAAHDLLVETWLAALLAFVSFSLVASSVYVINDLLDLAADRSHPRKRNRPFASGAIPLGHGTIMAPALFIAGAMIALTVDRLEFVAVVIAYYVLTMVYSLSLKRKLVIDIGTLAGLYTIRILAGGVATEVPLSVWLLAFSIFFFLSLAAVKRQTELVDALTSGREQAFGRAYRADDLSIVAMMAIASGYVAVLVMALYIDSSFVQSTYSDPRILWVICPVLLYWVSRLVMLAHRGKIDDDPILFAIRDQISRICGLLALGAVLAASFL